MRTTVRETCLCSVCSGRDVAPPASAFRFRRRGSLGASFPRPRGEGQGEGQTGKAVFQPLKKLAQNFPISFPEIRGAHPRAAVQLKFPFCR